MLNRRNLVKGFSGLGIFQFLGACSFAPDWDHADAEAPKSMTLSKPVRTAWVFGSGGPRGFVHVGVLKALQELGHAPDLLVGASVGALVATVFASGKSALEIERLALDIQPTGLGRLAIGGSEKFSGSAIATLVRREVDGVMLEKMRIPVACAVARRSDLHVMAFNAGDAGVAVQASCAIEGQFTPVRIRGEQYVDPDQYQPVPVRLARQLGATRILAIDASAHENKAPPSAGRFRSSDLKKRALTDADTKEADLTLHPDFGYYVNLSREFRERAIAAGYESTLAAAAQLAKLHGTS